MSNILKQYRVAGEDKNVRVINSNSMIKQFFADSISHPADSYTGISSDAQSSLEKTKSLSPDTQESGFNDGINAAVVTEIDVSAEKERLLEEADEMDLSAMKEIGNIIAGAYLSALSTMTNLKILPSIPYIAVDMAASILSVPAIQFGQYGDNALFIETEFGDDIMMNGYFILMPDLDSYDNILSALGISF